MDDDRVAKEFKRIQTVAALERRRVDIATFHAGLADAWKAVEKAQHLLGRLDNQLGRDEDGS